MARLPLRRHDRRTITGSFRETMYGFLNPRQIFKDRFTSDECSLCFFMVGTFHLIIALILFIGFGKLIRTLPHSGWLITQPALSLLAAFGFISLGALLYKHYVNAVKTAQIGIATYVVLVLINGIAIHQHLNIPFIMTLLLSLTVGGILLGIMLSIIVRLYKKSLAHTKHPEPLIK
jgi:hypothetical protein